MDRYDRMSFMINTSVFVFLCGVIWSALINSSTLGMFFLAFLVSGVVSGIASLRLPE